MKIIIPMSGTGSRFIAAGYSTYKPLIEMHGKPVIEHVTDLFPGENDFVFICREDHLAETPLEKILKKLKPGCIIVPIQGHKLGPVYTVSKAYDYIDDNEPVITNYCDFFMQWNYQDFKSTILKTGCEGAIPCYTGFHPHLLHKKNLYAGCLPGNNMMLKEITEKFSYSTDKSKAYHSAGTYYFKSGALVKKYFDMLMDEKIDLNGEYYISLVYNLLCRDGLDTLIYDKIKTFCQWGTPEDMEEYNTWSDIFKTFSQAK
ncbi:MAG: NTP transferase domain-containing protein [Bacteroidia bacterium]|nr:NTP transferase domain-containing protein [Bacteroidia bacterium]